MKWGNESKLLIEGWEKKVAGKMSVTTNYRTVATKSQFPKQQETA